MDLYIKEGIRLSEDTVAVESLAVALKRAPTAITEKTNSLLNIVTESYCNRWNVPRVVIATESFHSSARAQASVVACEGIVELAKAGWKRFIEWLKGLIGKVMSMINHFKARGKSLSQKADQLESLIAKAGDLELKDLSGSWSKLTMDGQVGFQKPVAFLKSIKSDASGFAKRTTSFINLSLDGKNTLFDVPWRGPVTMKAQQIEGMNKPQILAMPNNTLMVVGQRGRKPVVEMKPIEGKTSPIRSGNKAALEFCLEGIDAGIEFLEDRSNEFKEFIGTIERLTKTDKLPFENHTGNKLDDEDVNYYIGLARAGILAGATFIQHIDRFVEAATSGLLEYCYASFKASSKKDSGKDYGITPVFTKAVEKNDVKSIHIMMKDSLLVDLSFEQFDEMARLAKDVKGLYQEHKEGGHFDPLDLDPSKWDDNYMNSLMVDVVDNFSHERLNHLKKVVRKLRPPKGKNNESKKNNEAVAVPNAFKKAVDENNIRGMRIMLKNSLLVDHTFSEADSMLNYAKGVSGLFDDQNDKHMVIVNDSSKWDDNYMNSVMVDIIHNFTHERWEHLKKVVRKLHPANK